MLKRVLFVDNDNSFLEVYRKVFSSSESWKCNYAIDVFSAIDYLNYIDFDIIVVDLTLPLFDGSQLLDYVKKRYPSTIRIIFTACEDIESHIKVIKLGHQFFLKTTSVYKIEEAIKQIYVLYTVIINPKTRTFLSTLDNIPAMPDIFYSLKRKLQQESCSVKEVANIIASDIGLTATLLKIVNSDYFGITEKISDPFQATSLLGLQLINALVVSAHLFSLFKADNDLPLSDIMRHSLQCAKHAKTIATYQNYSLQKIEKITIAALLHDVGRLIFGNVLPHGFKNTMKYCDSTYRPNSEVESDVFGINHSQIGAYILGVWGFDLSVVEAVAFHHKPSTYKGINRDIVAIVHCADLLTYELTPFETHEGVETYDKEFMIQSNLMLSAQKWRSLCNGI